MKYFNQGCTSPVLRPLAGLEEKFGPQTQIQAIQHRSVSGWPCSVSYCDVGRFDTVTDWTSTFCFRIFLWRQTGRLMQYKGTVLASNFCLLPNKFVFAVPFLGAFAKLRKAAVSFVMFVCPSAWNNSAPPWRIFMNSYICFSKIWRENSSVIKIRLE